MHFYSLTDSYNHARLDTRWVNGVWLPPNFREGQGQGKGERALEDSFVCSVCIRSVCVYVQSTIFGSSFGGFSVGLLMLLAAASVHHSLPYVACRGGWVISTNVAIDATPFPPPLPLSSDHNRHHSFSARFSMLFFHRRHRVVPLVSGLGVEGWVRRKGRRDLFVALRRPQTTIISLRTLDSFSRAYYLR